MTTPLIRILIWIGTAYLVLNLYALLISDRMLFVPQPPTYTRLPDEVRIPVGKDETLAAVYLNHPAATHTLLFSHGNAEDLGNVVPFMQQFHQMGYSVLMYDYRGYGTSSGKPSTRKAKADIEAAYHWLIKEQGIKPEQIIVQGRSVGGGPSAWLAARYPVGGLILESTFVSAFRVRTHWPITPWDKFNNLKAMKNITCPALVIHARNDRIIPFWHGEALYNAAPEKKMNLWIDDAGHNDYAYVAGSAYFEAIQRFTNELPRQGSS